MAPATRASLDQKLAMAKRCSHEGVVAGAKAAVVAGFAAAVPTVSILFLVYRVTSVVFSSGPSVEPSLLASVGQRSDAAMGEVQPQPHSSSSHRLHSCRNGILHCCRQDCAGSRQEELLQGCLPRQQQCLRSGLD
ncbi:uncharacterized protein LOC135582676 isoform X1 [Musa acuminata AAA Group]|uniref:uncharacterized protein LOC135582676 isoform X1 n=1 Tax=Musa acuminata AAA Group TaxID=214697 RepID=UPI0031D1E9CC